MNNGVRKLNPLIQQILEERAERVRASGPNPEQAKIAYQAMGWAPTEAEEKQSKLLQKYYEELEKAIEAERAFQKKITGKDVEVDDAIRLQAIKQVVFANPDLSDAISKEDYLKLTGSETKPLVVTKGKDRTLLHQTALTDEDVKKAQEAGQEIKVVTPAHKSFKEAGSKEKLTRIAIETATDPEAIKSAITMALPIGAGRAAVQLGAQALAKGLGKGLVKTAATKIPILTDLGLLGYMGYETATGIAAEKEAAKKGLSATTGERTVAELIPSLLAGVPGFALGGAAVKGAAGVPFGTRGRGALQVGEVPSPKKPAEVELRGPEVEFKVGDELTKRAEAYKTAKELPSPYGPGKPPEIKLTGAEKPISLSPVADRLSYIKKILKSAEQEKVKSEVPSEWKTSGEIEAAKVDITPEKLEMPSVSVPSAPKTRPTAKQVLATTLSIPGVVTVADVLAQAKGAPIVSRIMGSAAESGRLSEIEAAARRTTPTSATTRTTTKAPDVAKTTGKAKVPGSTVPSTDETIEAPEVAPIEDQAKVPAEAEEPAKAPAKATDETKRVISTPGTPPPPPPPPAKAERRKGEEKSKPGAPPAPPIIPLGGKEMGARGMETGGFKLTGDVDLAQEALGKYARYLRLR